MATEPYEIIVGPGSIWVAPVGTSFPAVDATPDAPWTSLGATDGGVRISHVRETVEHGIDQSVLPQKRTLTRAVEEIRFSLVGLTLETYTKALDGASITPTAAGAGTAGDKAFAIAPALPEYAMLIRVPSPYMEGNLQYEYARVVRMDNSEVPYTKDGKTLLPTAWSALEDLDTPGQFGTIRAQHEAAL